MTEQFEEFTKIARYSRECIITEKLDGTNAQIVITEDGQISCGSRNRYITPEDDNFGFARWVNQNADSLRELGPGRHFGEWWGSGIQRGYGLTEKRFSLFNTHRWYEERPNCCHVVPILWHGNFDQAPIFAILEDLRINGSRASHGFMKPEGIVIFHTAANMLFKKTLEKDEVPKSMQAKSA